MLRSKYFRRCQKCRLSTVINDRQHGAQCDNCLTRTYFTLEQSMHGMWLCNILGNFSRHFSLSSSEFKGKRSIEGIEKPAATRRPCHCIEILQLSTSREEKQLQQESFIEGNALTRFLGSVEIYWIMQLYEGLVKSWIAILFAYRFR